MGNRLSKMLVLFFVFIAQITFAQEKTITGTVMDKEGNPLPGVNIVVKGTSTGVQTDFDGKFLIEASEGDILVFSFVGLRTTEYPIGVSNNVDVTLEVDAGQLDEVVVIGYGTQRRGEVTGSVAHVSEEDFTSGAIRDASELIKGKVAGLAISTGSGDPSAEAEVNLRGISSLQGGGAPLILINGIPGNFNTVSPNSVESITVLKDASAAAIYGTRGANGVILITTRDANANTPNTVAYSSYFGVSEFSKTLDFLDADQYRSLVAEDVLPDADEGASTDWLDEISRRGFVQNHNVELRGASNQSNYVANVNYMDQNGVFLKSYNEELNLSLDLNHYMFNDKLKLNLNVIKGLQNYGALGNGLSFNPNIYRQAVVRNPTEPVRDEEGNWQESLLRESLNPVALIAESDGVVENEWTRLTANAIVYLTEGWSSQLMLSTYQFNQVRGYSETHEHSSNTIFGLGGFASRGDRKSVTDIMELISTYRKTIDKHEFSVVGGYSYQYQTNSGGSSNNANFPSDAYSYHNLGTGAAILAGRADVGSFKNDNTLIGFFGRVNYGFDGKYDLLASVRREGSSKFGVNNKWGTFPAVSAGWTISNEAFLTDSEVIDNLKLRAGYGVTGIIPTDSYLSQTLLTYQGYNYNNGQWLQGLIPVSNPNPDLRWEKSSEVNIGVDYSLWNSRISGSVDVYHKKTKDLLWDYNVPTPPYLYNTIKANVGEMENKGIEVLLNVNTVRNENFNWTSTVTMSYNKNELTSLSNDLFDIDGDYFNTGYTGAPVQTYTHRLEVGRPVGEFFGYKTVDIDEEGVWIIETPDGTRKSILEASGDTDKQYIGNGVPSFYGGLTNTFQYRNFDLSVVLTGAFDFQILNFQRMYYENPTIQYNMLTSAFDDVYGKTRLNYVPEYVSYYVEDGDYVKVENMTLGYNLDLEGVGFFQSARLYASGQNLITFTDYKGVDPELEGLDPASGRTSNPLAPGIDYRDKYPSLTTYTIGLNVIF